MGRKHGLAIECVARYIVDQDNTQQQQWSQFVQMFALMNIQNTVQSKYQPMQNKRQSVKNKKSFNWKVRMRNIS